MDILTYALLKGKINSAVESVKSSGASELEMQCDGTTLQYRISSDGNWIDLIDLSEIITDSEFTLTLNDDGTLSLTYSGEE